MASQVGAINSINGLISKVFVQPKGDLADRLNSRITVCILAVSSGLLLSTHVIGDPINCWTPAQYTKAWADFVNQYCYVHGTYFAPLDEQLSFDEQQRKQSAIQYYQWVPYILALQALLFYLPRFVWKSLISFSGYDLAGAVKYVDKFWSTIKENDSSFKARLAAFEGRPSVYIWDGLRLARKKRSRDMALFFTLSTVLQFINAWLQFLVLNSVLDSPLYTFWGPSLLNDILTGEEWLKTGHFPRIVHCDFNMRRTSTVQVETVMCVLTLNTYYEKFFIFLWFWLFFVATVSTVNSMKWIYSLCSQRKEMKMIENYLATAPMKSSITNEQFMRALGPDGLFIVTQMALNLGDIPASYLVISMRNICQNWLEEDENEEYDDQMSMKRNLLTSVKTAN